jgi:hypothetical protein
MKQLIPSFSLTIDVPNLELAIARTMVRIAFAQVCVCIHREPLVFETNFTSILILS